MVNESEVEKRDASFEQLRTQVMAGLEMDEDQPPVDFILEDITTSEVGEYLTVIRKGQDVPDKLFKVSSYKVRNEGLFAMLCDYSCVYPIPKDLSKDQKIYFIESSDSAITLIPIDIGGKQINVNITLLQNSPEEVKNIYKNLNKLKMQDIKFVKFNNYK